MSISYRAEIDGLRTIAVLSVVIFHLGGTPLVGGFTGVDIFFVISGYLITSNIVKERNSQAQATEGTTYVDADNEISVSQEQA